MSINRFVCSVLKEMRKAVKVGRIDMLEGLIEEVQVLVNRMEAKLEDYSDLGYDLERGRDFKRKLKVLTKQANEIEKDMDDEQDIEI